GAPEGVIIGFGVSLGAVLAKTMIARPRSWQKILGASIGAMCAGIFLTITGGDLFSSSLEQVSHAFTNSQVMLDPLASFFGEVHFGQTSQIILGAVEALLFGAGMMAGMEYFTRARRDQQ